MTELISDPLTNTTTNPRRVTDRRTFASEDQNPDGNTHGPVWRPCPQRVRQPDLLFEVTGVSEGIEQLASRDYGNACSSKVLVL
jgi:hypothetical protein